MSEHKPRIGVPWRTAQEEKTNTRGKYDEYLRSIREAGGEPVEISLALDETARKKLDAQLDAYVLPGSPADVDPALYGATRQAKSADADPPRERTDYALIEDAFANAKPLLAICYGAQILNVCLGGSLIQDIASETHTRLRHSKEGLPKDSDDPLHAARIESGGEMGQLAAECGLPESASGFDAVVNTSHHQAIRDVGHGLRVSAVAPDGIVEAVEHEPHKHWVVGVQWHPERMPGDALSLALFRALIAATRGAAARR